MGYGDRTDAAGRRTGRRDARSTREQPVHLPCGPPSCSRASGPAHALRERARLVQLLEPLVLVAELADELDGFEAQGGVAGLAIDLRDRGCGAGQEVAERLDAVRRRIGVPSGWRARRPWSRLPARCNRRRSCPPRPCVRESGWSAAHSLYMGRWSRRSVSIHTRITPCGRVAALSARGSASALFSGMDRMTGVPQKPRARGRSRQDERQGHVAAGQAREVDDRRLPAMRGRDRSFQQHPPPTWPRQHGR